MSKRARRARYPAVNYSIGLCEICQLSMSFQEMRQAVYWLPDMDEYELSWAKWEGFSHRMAHRPCWLSLREKRRDLIRLCSFKDQEPRSQGQPI